MLPRPLAVHLRDAILRGGRPTQTAVPLGLLERFGCGASRYAKRVSRTLGSSLLLLLLLLLLHAQLWLVVRLGFLLSFRHESRLPGTAADGRTAMVREVPRRVYLDCSWAVEIPATPGDAHSSLGRIRAREPRPRHACATAGGPSSAFGIRAWIAPCHDQAIAGAPFMSWLALSLSSAVFLGLYDVAKKASVDRNAVIPVLFACSATGALLVTPACLLTWWAPAWADTWGVRLLPLGASGHALILLKAGIVTLSWVLTFFALKELPISLAAPIRASAPLFTLLGAVVLFGERPSTTQWVGIGTTLGAYYAFSVIGRAEGIHFSRSRPVWLLALGTLVGSISGLYDKQLLQTARLPAASVQFWFTWYNALLQGVLVLAFWRRAQRRLSPFRWRWSIPAVAALLLLADALYFHALAQPDALVSVVATLRRTNVIVSFAVGGLAFQEKHRGKKALALGGVLAGLFLIMR